MDRLRMLPVILLALLLTIPTFSVQKKSSPFHVHEEDAKLRVPQLIRKYGYPVERHRVRTEDNYLLGTFRIPGRLQTNINTTSPKHPILLMHSWFSSSSDWVLIGPKHGLAYLLADLGYDVWLGNARGNRYSRRHRHLRTRSPEFWDFSFHEIGFYDVPALIDYVLRRTNSSKLHYVGFSQGTIAALVALSSRPAYNEKVIELQLLSPAVYLHQIPSVTMRLLALFGKSLANGFNSVGSHDLLPNQRGQYEFFRNLCPSPNQFLCRLVIYDLAGANPSHLDAKMLRIFLGHFPAGSAVRQFLHYVQIISDGIFRQYDYEDEQLNEEKYGSKTVPEYNLTRVTAPVRIYYGLNDNVVNYRNIRQLERRLPNVVQSYLVPDERFNHIDFILSKHVKELLYRKVMDNVVHADKKAH